MNWQKHSRRKHKRVKSRLLVFCSDRGKNLEPIDATAVDISLSGLKIISDTLFSPRDTIDLELYQPYNIKNELICSLHIVGKIIWTQEIKIMNQGIISKGFQLGVQFVEISNSSLGIISSFIDSYGTPT